MTANAGTRSFNVYQPNGSRSAPASLPALDASPWSDDPAGYVAEEGLQDAVNVALSLGQPLLVTGEPGTGKTQLAGSVAYSLGLPAPLVFRTKSTSVARDLFYRYEALQHFHDAQFREEASAIDRYVTFEALGLAILASASSADAGIHLPKDLRDRAPLRSVVLIDEIDKAPRDLPNDVLDEVESMSFTVKETGRTFSADRRYKPIVILTSNSEKTLPDAFLRRCVFFHLTFPSGDRLMEIARRRIGPSRFDDEDVKLAIRHFEEIRSLALRKKPSTAELIAWLRVLDALDVSFRSGRATNRDALIMSYAVLAKNKDDIAVLADRIG